MDNWQEVVKSRGKHKYFLFNANCEIVTVVNALDGYLTIESVYIEDIHNNLRQIINRLKYGLITSHTIQSLSFMNDVPNLSSYVIML